jgi:hypothetical protein
MKKTHSNLIAEIDKIGKKLAEDMKGQINSMCASPNEVTIAWFIMTMSTLMEEIEELKHNLEEARACKVLDTETGLICGEPGLLAGCCYDHAVSCSICGQPAYPWNRECGNHADDDLIHMKKSV